MSTRPDPVSAEDFVRHLTAAVCTPVVRGEDNPMIPTYVACSRHNSVWVDPDFPCSAAIYTIQRRDSEVGRLAGADALRLAAEAITDSDEYLTAQDSPSKACRDFLNRRADVLEGKA